MRFVTPVALAIVLAVTSGAVSAPAMAAKKEKEQKAPQLKPTAKYLEAYQKVDVAIKAKDAAAAKAALAESEAVATSADDKQLVASQQVQIGLLAPQDNALIRKGLEGQLAGGNLGAADAAKYHGIAGDIAFDAKDFDAAVAHYKASGDTSKYPRMAEAYVTKAIALGGPTITTPESKTLVQEAIAILKQTADAETAAGRKPDEGLLKRGEQLSMVIKSPGASEWTAMRLKQYPNGDTWGSVLRQLYSANISAKSGLKLDIFRLMDAAGALEGDNAYRTYYELARVDTSYGEAQAILTKARAAQVPLKDATDESLLAGKIAADRKTLDVAGAEAAKSAKGADSVFAAKGYLAYGEYAKALAQYEAALQKGGVDADEVNSRIGYTKYKLNDLPGAQAAFAKVQAGPRKALANYWLTLIASKGTA
ncbi:MAG: hypothetical protein ABW039_00965 [Sphingobium sp.]